MSVGTNAVIVRNGDDGDGKNAAAATTCFVLFGRGRNARFGDGSGEEFGITLRDAIPEAFHPISALSIATISGGGACHALLDRAMDLVRHTLFLALTGRWTRISL